MTQPTASERDLPRLPQLETAWASSGAPGAALGLIRDGRLAEVRLLGTTCPTDGRPIDATTSFDGASLSKPVVARWTAELARDGALDLDTPIALPPELVGAAPDARLAEITPAMLLSHCAGFPNWRPPGEPLRLLADPGTRIVYSGEGFEYLLAWLRQERGADTVDRELAAALARWEMADSSFTDADDHATRRAAGHTATGERIERVARPVARAAGSLHTSLDDYARFVCTTMWGPDPAAQAVRELMVEVRVAADESARTIGWGAAATATGTVLWQHGDNPGFKHLVGVRPEAGSGVIALTNGDGGVAVIRAAAAAIGVPARHLDGSST
jgi:CubicO group peptidase (beta-lactamase class C family)